MSQLQKPGLIEARGKTAVAESFFHTIKTELIYNYSYSTREDARESIFNYIEVYYNRIRRHSAVGSIAPINFENQGRMVA